MSTTVLAAAAKAADDAKLLLEQIHRLERAAIIGNDLDFEVRMDIAIEMGEALDRLNAYRVRVLG
jgi:hypothetical protein